jgi:carboxyl-terminal processing protease
VKSRIAANPEFQYIVDESKRLKEKIDRNTVTLNLAEREKERLETEARRDKQNEEREKRTKDTGGSHQGQRLQDLPPHPRQRGQA